MEEPEDPGLQAKHTTTKMTKRRWGHRALPTGFTPCQYPKVSNYPMISKNMMDPRSHSHGSQIICKNKNIGRNQGNSHAKFVITPHQRGKVVVEQVRKRNNSNLGRAHKAIYEQLQVDI
jgi:hypothetical protein